MRGAVLLLAAAAVAGCAGRAPQPIATVNAEDRLLDCPTIIAEMQSHNYRLEQLSSEQGWKAAQNVAAGVAGLVVWPLWFGMDFQGSAGIEAAAIQDRQRFLVSLAEQRHCAPLSPAKR